MTGTCTWCGHAAHNGPCTRPIVVRSTTRHGAQELETVDCPCTAHLYRNNQQTGSRS